nr:Tmn-2 [Streptomyces sp.]
MPKPLPTPKSPLGAAPGIAQSAQGRVERIRAPARGVVIIRRSRKCPVFPPRIRCPILRAPAARGIRRDQRPLPAPLVYQGDRQRPSRGLRKPPPARAGGAGRRQLGARP